MFVRMCPLSLADTYFFFNDTATTEIYTLSLHDALPISRPVHRRRRLPRRQALGPDPRAPGALPDPGRARSEEHTSELQSHLNIVCRLLLEKKNTSAPGRSDRSSS